MLNPSPSKWSWTRAKLLKKTHWSLISHRPKGIILTALFITLGNVGFFAWTCTAGQTHLLKHIVRRGFSEWKAAPQGAREQGASGQYRRSLSTMCSKGADSASTCWENWGLSTSAKSNFTFNKPNFHVSVMSCLSCLNHVAPFCLWKSKYMIYPQALFKCLNWVTHSGFTV